MCMCLCMHVCMSVLVCNYTIALVLNPFSKYYWHSTILWKFAVGEFLIWQKLIYYSLALSILDIIIIYQGEFVVSLIQYSLVNTVDNPPSTLINDLPYMCKFRRIKFSHSTGHPQIFILEISLANFWLVSIRIGYLLILKAKMVDLWHPWDLHASKICTYTIVY